MLSSGWVSRRAVGNAAYICCQAKSTFGGGVSLTSPSFVVAKSACVRSHTHSHIHKYTRATSPPARAHTHMHTQTHAGMSSAYSHTNTHTSPHLQHTQRHTHTGIVFLTSGREVPVVGETRWDLAEGNYARWPAVRPREKDPSSPVNSLFTPSHSSPDFSFAYNGVVFRKLLFQT